MDNKFIWKTCSGCLYFLALLQLVKTVTTVSVYQFNVAFSNEKKSKFGHFLARLGTFVQPDTGQTGLAVNNKLNDAEFSQQVMELLLL